MRIEDGAMNEVVEQLVDGLDARVAWTLEILGWHDLATEVRRRLPDAARLYALQLSCDDPREAAQIVIDLAGVAWDADPPRNGGAHRLADWSRGLSKLAQ